MTIEAGQHEAVPYAVPKRPLPRLSRAALGRAGRAALLATGRGPVPDAIEPIVQAHRVHHPQADLALLGRAYRTAETSHRGQTRKSGEPFITHPLAVTMILAQLGAGTTTLVASLLHDTVEDTEVTLAQVSADFGPEVAYLVDGVTKLEKVDFGAAAEAETFRKMLVATGDDVRVMVIKLADRLHNMRTIRHMKPASRIRIAKVTRDVLIPLAERLGIQVVKAELEDIVFATLHPEEYARTGALLAVHEARPDGLLQPFAQALARQLAETGVQASVAVRPRHHVSAHRVLLKRNAAAGPDGRPQGLLPADLGRLLVVVEENADCYAVLGELHTCWTPLPGEFKDFIAAPGSTSTSPCTRPCRCPAARWSRYWCAPGRCTGWPSSAWSPWATRTRATRRSRPATSPSWTAPTRPAPAGSAGCSTGSRRPRTRTPSGPR